MAINIKSNTAKALKQDLIFYLADFAARNYYVHSSLDYKKGDDFKMDNFPRAVILGIAIVLIAFLFVILTGNFSSANYSPL